MNGGDDFRKSLSDLSPRDIFGRLMREFKTFQTSQDGDAVKAANRCFDMVYPVGYVDQDLERAHFLVREATEELRRTLGEFMPLTKEQEDHIEAVSHRLGFDNGVL